MSLATFTKEYEVEIAERSAILQEAGVSAFEAENRAIVEVKQRLEAETAEAEVTPEPLKNEPSSELERLRAERHEAGEKYIAAIDPGDKAKLRNEWMKLNRKIIEVRKG